jgi:hypothetical protein
MFDRGEPCTQACSGTPAQEIESNGQEDKFSVARDSELGAYRPQTALAGMESKDRQRPSQSLRSAE